MRPAFYSPIKKCAFLPGYGETSGQAFFSAGFGARDVEGKKDCRLRTRSPSARGHRLRRHCRTHQWTAWSSSRTGNRFATGLSVKSAESRLKMFWNSEFAELILPSDRQHSERFARKEPRPTVFVTGSRFTMTRPGRGAHGNEGQHRPMRRSPCPFLQRSQTSRKGGEPESNSRGSKTAWPASSTP